MLAELLSEIRLYHYLCRTESWINDTHYLFVCIFVADTDFYVYARALFAINKYATMQNNAFFYLPMWFASPVEQS